MSFCVRLTGRLGFLRGFNFGLCQFESFLQSRFGLFAGRFRFLVLSVERLLRGFRSSLLCRIQCCGEFVGLAFFACLFSLIAFRRILASFCRGFGDFLLRLHRFQGSCRVARFELLRGRFGLLLGFQGIFNILSQSQRIRRGLFPLSLKLSGFRGVDFFSGPFQLLQLLSDRLFGFFDRFIDGPLGDFDFLQLRFGQRGELFCSLGNLFTNCFRSLSEFCRSRFCFRSHLLRFFCGVCHRVFESLFGGLHRRFVFLLCRVGHFRFRRFGFRSGCRHFVERLFGFLGFGESIFQGLCHFWSRLFKTLGNLLDDVGNVFLFLRECLGFFLRGHFAFGDFFRRVRDFSFGRGGSFERLGGPGELANLHCGFHPLRFGDLFFGRGEGSLKSLRRVFELVFCLSFRFFVGRSDFLNGSFRCPVDRFLG